MDRSNNFDGVRLVAALTVLVSHQFVLTGKEGPMVGGFAPGSYAVLVFFAMSGYLVTASWTRDPNLLRFMARRLLRIWPALAIVVVTCASIAIFLDFDPPFGRMAGQEYLYNLAFAGFDWPFFQTNPWHLMNGSLWSIPYEVKCYVALAVLGVLGGRHLKCVTLLAAASMIVWFIAIGGQSGFDVISRQPAPGPALVFYGAFFLAGSLLFQIKASDGILLAISATGALPLAAGQWFPGLVLLISPLTVLVGRGAWPGLRSAGRHGDLSYGVYLWASPVQQVIVLWLGKQMPFLLLLGLSTACTFALAWLSWHLVESRALRLKPGNLRQIDRSIWRVPIT